MKFTFSFLLLAVMAAGCSRQPVARPEAYAAYLSPEPFRNALARQQDELSFWTRRLQQDTGSYVNLLEVGCGRLGLFHLSGRVGDLLAADSLVNRASEKLRHTDPDLLQTLAQIAITRHRFREADSCNRLALARGGSPFLHRLVSFDADMELGRYAAAGQSLSALADKGSFDFLIRQAKFADQRGDAAASIRQMEQAFEKIRWSNRDGLYCWALANLGDMYAHNGRINDAYAAYLGVLKKDPAYLYALKGIARIAFAHDGNVAEARRIVQFLQAQTGAPDLLLALAEMAGYEGKEKERVTLERRFVQLVGRPEYGDLYNKYLVDVLAEHQPAEALRLAAREVANRPTPESYSGLAWAHYRLGQTEKAYHLYQTYAAGRSSEPDVLYKGAFILAASGKKKEAAALWQKCRESAFELGPVRMEELGIRNWGKAISGNRNS